MRITSKVLKPYTEIKTKSIFWLCYTDNLKGMLLILDVNITTKIRILSRKDRDGMSENFLGVI